MYCREEESSEKSLRRIINDDLRSRAPNKIYRYINILALINLMIKEKGLACFEGKVYRATKLDEKLIMKLTPGTKMVNTIFWSTTKDFKVAEEFLIKNNFINSLIICKTTKNNIDIDFEKLNPLNETEVLFLPFTEFKVENIYYIQQYGKKVVIIELFELGNENFVNPDNMQLKIVKSLPTNKIAENYFEDEGINYKDLILKSSNN